MMHVSSGGEPKWPDHDPRGARNVTFSAVELRLTVKAAKDWVSAIRSDALCGLSYLF